MLATQRLIRRKGAESRRPGRRRAERPLDGILVIEQMLALRGEHRGFRAEQRAGER